MGNLVIAPHIDDEVLGCSGVLDENTYVFYCGVSPFHIVSSSERLAEANDVKEYFGHKFELYVHANQSVNAYDGKHFINVFQDLINKVKPERVYIPYPSYNQDHQQVYHAAMVALRPHDTNHFAKKVLVYEMPDCLWYNPEYEVSYFIPIDIKTKIEGYKLHASQVRGHRSFEHLKALATLRGSMIGEAYAEAFIVRRWVE
jgi:LmbE family N-acetylglucosaminyl deacetylase